MLDEADRLLNPVFVHKAWHKLHKCAQAYAYVQYTNLSAIHEMEVQLAAKLIHRERWIIFFAASLQGLGTECFFRLENVTSDQASDDSVLCHAECSVRQQGISAREMPCPFGEVARTSDWSISVCSGSVSTSKNLPCVHYERILKCLLNAPKFI